MLYVSMQYLINVLPWCVIYNANIMYLIYIIQHENMIWLSKGKQFIFWNRHNACFCCSKSFAQWYTSANAEGDGFMLVRFSVNDFTDYHGIFSISQTWYNEHLETYWMQHYLMFYWCVCRLFDTKPPSEHRWFIINCTPLETYFSEIWYVCGLRKWIIILPQ